MHREFRAQSLNSICAALKRSGVEHTTPGEVRSKMNNLRNYYASEKRKEKKTADTELPYKTNWKFFNELRFLDESYRPRTRISNNKNNNNDNVIDVNENLGEIVTGNGREEGFPPPHSPQHSMEIDIGPTMVKIRGTAYEEKVDSHEREPAGKPPNEEKVDSHEREPARKPSAAKYSKISSSSSFRQQPFSPPSAKTMKIDNMIQPSVVETHQLASDGSNSETVVPPASSFMTVFRKARKNSKLMYSMNESANFVVETRPVYENSSKNFRMNRRTSSNSTPTQFLIVYEDIENNQTTSADSGGVSSHVIFRKQNPNVEPTLLPQHSMPPGNSLKISPLDLDSTLAASTTTGSYTAVNATSAAADSRSQNLDKCYADLIYQILVSMPDSVEKAMLKLDFQQKLIQLKYNQANGSSPSSPRE